MRILNFLLCAGALAGCASGKSAERPDEEWTESEPPMESVEVYRDPEPEVASGEGREANVADAPAGVRDARPEAASKRAVPADERAEAAQDRDEKRAGVQQPPAGTPPDNTDVNERDTDDRSLTPLDQGGSEGDRKITQQIRQAVVGDDSLSFTAKNVKIITVDGKVTLRGPVKSQQERATIDAAAKRIAGPSVDNQLEVAK
jgi:hyperosmotically inducible periplasmic protein